MKATVDRRALAGALKTVLPASPRSGAALPVLSGVHILGSEGRLTLTCTNLDLTITTIVEAEVGEPGVVVVPAVVIARIIDKLNGATVNLSLEDDQLVIGSGRAATQLRTLDVETWPKVHPVDGEGLELATDTLAGISRLLHAASDDIKEKPALLGLHLAPGIIEATDSFRAARLTVDKHDLPDVIVPASVVRIVLGTGAERVRFTATGLAATFTVDATTWTTRLVADDFPPMGRMMASLVTPHPIEIDTEALAETVARVNSLGADTAGSRITITHVDNELVVENNVHGVGHIDDTIEATGDLPHPMVFKGQYLTDLLTAAGPGVVTMQCGRHGGPVVINVGALTLMLMSVTA